MSNKISGNKFEKVMADILSKEGFWVLRITPAVDGSQPADLIAVKDGVPTLIDCKVLSNKTGKFPLSRIEVNQFLACDKWERCGNLKRCYRFAILWDGGIHFISMENILSDVNNTGYYDLNGREPRWQYAD
jgi:hypothetical protein